MPRYLAAFLLTDKGYRVTFPDIPGLASFGATIQEAYDNAAVALRRCLQKFRRPLPPAMKKKEILSALERSGLARLGVLVRPVDSFDAEIVEASNIFRASEKSLLSGLPASGGD